MHDISLTLSGIDRFSTQSHRYQLQLQDLIIKLHCTSQLSGEVLAWLSVWNKVQTCIWLSWCHCHSLSLASVKSRLVLPWYRPTRVVQEKGPLNGGVCVCVIIVNCVRSVLRCCWLGVRRSIRPVKNWVMRCWCGYLPGARCILFACGPADATVSSLASFKSRLVIPFWYRITRVVLEKRSLNGCSCSSSSGSGSGSGSGDSSNSSNYSQSKQRTKE